MTFPHQAKLLKEIRESIGLTQAQFAKAIRVHPQFVSNMERGVAGIPVSVAKRIAKKGYGKDLFLFAAEDDFKKNWIEEWK